MTVTRKEKHAIWARMPWIFPLKNAVPCEGVKWSHVPLKAIYGHGPDHALPPTGVDPYRCKLMAHWRFKSLKNSYARDGRYCVHHLWSSMHGDMDEYDRVEKWLDANVDQILAELRGEVVSGTR